MLLIQCILNILLISGCGGGNNGNFTSGGVISNSGTSYICGTKEIPCIQTGDGLKLDFNNEGSIQTITSPAGSLNDQDKIYESGFFIKDIVKSSNRIHMKGSISTVNDKLFYKANNSYLGIEVEAFFTGSADHIDLDIYLEDLSGNDRALTLYFVLPIHHDNWEWGDDMRNSQDMAESEKYINPVYIDIGSDGTMSRYPIAAIYNNDGLAIGYPLDSPALIRLAARPYYEQRQLQIEYDVALSDLTKTPGAVHLKAVLYRFDPAWGFRSALKKYYEIYPDFFDKRITNEGLWVFHPKYLNNIPNIEDFGIAVHTYNFDSYSLPFEDDNNIYSLHYLVEPSVMKIPNPENAFSIDYSGILGYLDSSQSNGDLFAIATLNSGVLDFTDSYMITTEGSLVDNRCQDCSVVTVNPDPDIEDNNYSINYAQYYWNNSATAPYSSTSAGALDGEFVDSIELLGTTLDYNANHLKAADLPLTYAKDNYKPAIPLAFSSYEFAKWVAHDIHSMGKIMMSNSVPKNFAFPAHLFDVLGIEIDGNIMKIDNDQLFNFWRALSYQKPFCLLYYYGDYSGFTPDVVEQYFKKALFYGFYPGIIGDDALLNDRYFEDPEKYERDRNLFKKYIPLIKKLGKAGWEPVTFVKSSDPAIYVERYGSGDTLLITVLNAGDTTLNYELQLN